MGRIQLRETNGTSQDDFALLAIWVHRNYRLLGFTHDSLVEKHFDGFECSNLLEGVGAEDIATTKDGLAFITSGLMYPPYSFKPKDGKVFVTTLEEAPVKLLETKIVGGEGLNLNPHGIDLIEVDNRILIYIVNHKNDLSQESVEKFEYSVERNELIWLATFTSDAFRSVNDVALVAEDEFYATNDHYFSLKNQLLRSIETYSVVKLGSLVHCKGGKCSIISSYSLAMPNGISVRQVTDATGQKKTEVLVVYCYDLGVGVYEIDVGGGLVYKQTIPTSSPMDNLWVSPDGAIYAAGHPSAWKFMLAIWNPAMALQYPPSSEVLSLAPNGYVFEQRYLDEGRQFMGSSIAVFWDKNILIGSPTGNLMECHQTMPRI